MKRVVLFLVPLLIFILLAGFLFRGLWLNPREVPSPLIGKPAPVFETAQLDEQASFAVRQMQGQVWLLNVWASWCAPCRQEHPLWNQLAAQKLVPIIGLNYKDEPANARKWLGDLGNPYQLIATDRAGRIAIDYGVYGVPETFVIDKQGVIRYKHIGPVDEAAMQKKIVPLVRELQGRP